MPANPVGGNAWNQTVTQGGSGIVARFDKKQMELVRKSTAYFNDLGDLKGAFVQTGADNKRMRGKFFVKRPGKFRFDYALPTRLLIVSDGEYLAIQDLDLKTDDRVALDQTPFRVLLRKDVDLMRDARIIEVQDVETSVVLACRTRARTTPGASSCSCQRSQP